MRRGGVAATVPELAVTELVTNVIRHTDSAEVRVWAYLGEDGPVIEVWDDSPTFPVVREFDLTSTSGRGLAMLTALGVSLGWGPAANGGKAVRAVLNGAAR
ncbi:hypothetical protein GCM10009678_16930 [Actinomadura kijaniata]|uniref:Two-component sensor histidine kinase n=1 Tax=Actinomadura namibiensis TaxID=182080 RepID=A0A7W3LIK2_ACTNM|nr:ATP-binding protein [Actinomadura namibiensis]MBA8948826.1 two-component sensor histidine kinase [Actinomadura namibiensis]